MDQKHLHFTLRDLRRAYQAADAQPCAGAWRAEYPTNKGSTIYRCPINLMYTSMSIAEAQDDTKSPPKCIVAFLLGWEDSEDAMPSCQRCYRLGVRLRAKLQPVWIGR
jgi:hypothetical protein